MKRTILVMTLASAAALAADLPVRQITLYKNGIGYFMRAGELKTGESARLDFNAAEMNDVLKSLTVFDEKGGKISAIRYDASEPQSRRLEPFPFQLGPSLSLSALLDQLRGARAEFRTGPEVVAGSVLSGREIPGSIQVPPRQEVTLLADSGDLRTLDLASVTAVRFSDPKLSSQFKDYLAVLVSGRAKDKRSVYIDSDATARRLSAAYVIPAPVWKSSYRLVFRDAGPATLEGWAIVDNTTGEDWSNVRLALVSGKPVSFVSQLYEPRYVRRMQFDLPEQEAAGAELHEGPVDYAASAAAPPPPAAAPAPLAVMDKQLRREAAFGSAEGGRVAPVFRSDRVSSILSVAAGELGELFEYRFEQPVTVRKGESAMLPFVQQEIAARKLLVYNAANGEHPRNAAEITNTSGKTLDGGPITVFDAGAYAGEAPVETVKTGDKRLISYAVDLGTRITTNIDSSAEVVREIHVRRGILAARTAARQTTTYTVRNVDARPKVLIVEHPLQPQFKLVGAKPIETTGSAYRFEMKLGASAGDKLPVAEERVFDQTYALASATPDFLLTFAQNKALDAAARRQLELISGQKAKIASADADIARTTEAINEATRDEERVRQNIYSLNQVSGQQNQVQVYARQIAEKETEIAALRDRAAGLKKARAALQSELNALIEQMDF